MFTKFDSQRTGQKPFFIADDRVITYGENGYSVWDLTGALVYSSSEPVKQVLKNSDGKTFITQGERIAFWNILDGSLIKDFQLPDVGCIALHPKLPLLAVGNFKNLVRIIDLEGNVQNCFSGNHSGQYGDRISDLAFTADGNYLGTNFYNATDFVLQTFDGEVVKRIEGHARRTISAQGTVVAGVRMRSNEIELFSFYGQQIGTLCKHDNFVNRIRFSADGKFLIGTDDKKECVWNSTGECVREARRSYESFLAQSPSGQTTAFVNNDSMLLQDTTLNPFARVELYGKLKTVTQEEGALNVEFKEPVAMESVECEGNIPFKLQTHRLSIPGPAVKFRFDLEGKLEFCTEKGRLVFAAVDGTCDDTPGFNPFG